ncbi:MAG TPA: hypothetical protein VMW15_08870 [Terracidiphilus sp.]|nr:hypothetical protein [Terracidiphilus sp.]
MVTIKQKAGFIEAIAPRPKTQTEMKRRVRSQSSTDAMLTVEWLNAAQRTAAYRRVLMVRGELEELGAMLESLRQQRQAWKNRRAKSDAEILENLKASTSMVSLQEQFRQRHNALNVLLARYAHVPALAYSLNSGIWRFGMVPKHPRGPEIKLSDESFNVRVNESTVIAALARLAANHELHKVRLCETCGERWRVSERKIDRFCSQQCRDAFHISSPDYKDRKAANQRKYRESLKQNMVTSARYFESKVKPQQPKKGR